MTKKHDDTSDDRISEGMMSERPESMEGGSDFAEEATLDDLGDDSGDGEAAGGELTPNDIFGLDPLDVLTLEELAEYLKVSPAAAHRVIKEQKLPGRNIGGEWRFLRDAVANWLRCQEAPVQQQQKAREDYSKPKVAPPRDDEGERFARPPQRPPYQAEPKRPYSPEPAGEYRPRQRFPEGGQQYGNQGGGQYGNRRQYGGSQYGSGQSGGYGGGQYGGGGNSGGGAGGYAPPPRRPFGSTEEGGQKDYGAGSEGGSFGGGGARFGGGYQAGSQRFGGGPKRKNKRQVFDNERGKRLDRRKEGDASDSDES